MKDKKAVAWMNIPNTGNNNKRKVIAQTAVSQKVSKP